MTGFPARNGWDGGPAGAISPKEMGVLRKITKEDGTKTKGNQGGGGGRFPTTTVALARLGYA